MIMLRDPATGRVKNPVAINSDGTAIMTSGGFTVEELVQRLKADVQVTVEGYDARNAEGASAGSGDTKGCKKAGDEKPKSKQAKKNAKEKQRRKKKMLRAALADGGMAAEGEGAGTAEQDVVNEAKNAERAAPAAP
jgi:hypothetical protein